MTRHERIHPALDRDAILAALRNLPVREALAVFEEGLPELRDRPSLDDIDLDEALEGVIKAYDGYQVRALRHVEWREEQVAACMSRADWTGQSSYPRGL